MARVRRAWRKGVREEPAFTLVPAAAGAGTQDPQARRIGEFHKLGIPTIADRVVQAALKLVLEPIFEADFQPVCYGFRVRRDKPAWRRRWKSSTLKG
jgi:hypothetical protein